MGSIRSINGIHASVCCCRLEEELNSDVGSRRVDVGRDPRATAIENPAVSNWNNCAIGDRSRALDVVEI